MLHNPQPCKAENKFASWNKNIMIRKIFQTKTFFTPLLFRNRRCIFGTGGNKSEKSQISHLSEVQ